MSKVNLTQLLQIVFSFIESKMCLQHLFGREGKLPDSENFFWRTELVFHQAGSRLKVKPATDLF